MRRHRLAVLAAVLVLAAVVPARALAAAPTPNEAKAFIEQAESRLLHSDRRRARIGCGDVHHRRHRADPSPGAPEGDR